jgi:hypothetical protein
MSFSRAVPIHVHSALEVVAAPLLFVAPFALGFSLSLGALSIALGIVLIGLALSIDGGEGGTASLPLTAHANFDFVLATGTIALGLIGGIVTQDPVAGIFMAGFGTAHMALTASTRYSRPLGA